MDPKDRSKSSVDSLIDMFELELHHKRKKGTAEKADTVKSSESKDHLLDEMVGQILKDQFQIISKIGEGGMGAVYLARSLLLDKEVAIKIMKRMEDEDSYVDRFLREARNIAKLEHKNIMRLHHVDRLDETTYFLVTEYIKGGSLKNLLKKKKRLSLDDSLHIVLQILDALNHAHTSETKIIHRDLKPENILIALNKEDPLFIKVIDFGLAKELDPEVGEGFSNLEKGYIYGTPQYMSPEQSRGAEIDERSDLYSLGVIFYQMLSGKLPFQADNKIAYMIQTQKEAPIPLRLASPEHEIPADIERIVFKMLEKEKERRYQSAAQISMDLNQYQWGADDTGRLKKGAVEKVAATQKEQVNFENYHAGMEAAEEYFQKREKIGLSAVTSTKALNQTTVAEKRPVISEKGDTVKSPPPPIIPKTAEEKPVSLKGVAESQKRPRRISKKWLILIVLLGGGVLAYFVNQSEIKYFLKTRLDKIADTELPREDDDMYNVSENEPAWVKMPSPIKNHVYWKIVAEAKTEDLVILRCKQYFYYLLYDNRDGRDYGGKIPYQDLTPEKKGIARQIEKFLYEKGGASRMVLKTFFLRRRDSKFRLLNVKGVVLIAIPRVDFARVAEYIMKSGLK